MPLDAIQHSSFDKVDVYEIDDHDGPTDNLSKLCLNIIISWLENIIYKYIKSFYHQNSINAFGLINQ